MPIGLLQSDVSDRFARSDWGMQIGPLVVIGVRSGFQVGFGDADLAFGGQGCPIGLQGVIGGCRSGFC
jgi:hypothetical protein